jgi:hypothetical protein
MGVAPFGLCRVLPHPRETASGVGEGRPRDWFLCDSCCRITVPAPLAEAELDGVMDGEFDLIRELE